MEFIHGLRRDGHWFSRNLEGYWISLSGSKEWGRVLWIGSKYYVGFRKTTPL
jgi:hypothetical protein